MNGTSWIPAPSLCPGVVQQHVHGVAAADRRDRIGLEGGPSFIYMVVLPPSSVDEDPIGSPSGLDYIQRMNTVSLSVTPPLLVALAATIGAATIHEKPDTVDGGGDGGASGGLVGGLIGRNTTASSSTGCSAACRRHDRNYLDRVRGASAGSRRNSRSPP